MRSLSIISFIIKKRSTVSNRFEVIEIVEKFNWTISNVKSINSNANNGHIISSISLQNLFIIRIFHSSLWNLRFALGERFSPNTVDFKISSHLNFVEILKLDLVYLRFLQINSRNSKVHLFFLISEFLKNGSCVIFCSFLLHFYPNSLLWNLWIDVDS